MATMPFLDNYFDERGVLGNPIYLSPDCYRCWFKGDGRSGGAIA